MALARGLDDAEFKIATRGLDLLTRVLDVWENSEGVPLFVCEGTSDYKAKAIMGSSYLQRVSREVLPQIGDSLVIYGWGIADQEAHILKRLSQANCQRVAVSVYNGDAEFMRHAEEKLRNAGITEILFFDSRSQGCWNNPA